MSFKESGPGHGENIQETQRPWTQDQFNAALEEYRAQIKAQEVSEKEPQEFVPINKQSFSDPGLFSQALDTIEEGLQYHEDIEGIIKAITEKFSSWKLASDPSFLKMRLEQFVQMYIKLRLKNIDEDARAAALAQVRDRAAHEASMHGPLRFRNVAPGYREMKGFFDWEEDSIKDALLVRFLNTSYSPPQINRLFLTQFLRDTAPFIERKVDSNFDRSTSKQELFDAIRAQKGAEKMNFLLQFVEIESSFVLSNLDSLGLGDDQTQFLVERIIREDIEAFAAHAPYISWEDFPSVEVTAEYLSSLYPDVFFSVCKHMNLDRGVLKDIIDDRAGVSPDAYLGARKSLRAENVWSKDDFLRWDQAALEALASYTERYLPEVVIEKINAIEDVPEHFEETVFRVYKRAIQDVVIEYGNPNLDEYMPEEDLDEYSRRKAVWAKDTLQSEDKRLQSIITNDGSRLVVVLLEMMQHRDQDGNPAVIDEYRLIDFGMPFHKVEEVLARLSKRDKMIILEYINAQPELLGRLDEHSFSFWFEVVTDYEASFVEDVIEGMMEHVDAEYATTAIIDALGKCDLNRMPSLPRLIDRLIDVTLKRGLIYVEELVHKKELSKHFSDEQRMRIFQAVVEVNPVFAWRGYNGLRLRDAQKEDQLLTELFEGGVRPFSDCADVRTLKTLITKRGSHKLIEQRDEITSLQALIGAKKKHGDKFWEFVLRKLDVSDYEGYPWDAVADMTPENYDALALLLQNNPDILKDLEAPRWPGQKDPMDQFDEFGVLTRLTPDMVDEYVQQYAVAKQSMIDAERAERKAYGKRTYQRPTRRRKYGSGVIGRRLEDVQKSDRMEHVQNMKEVPMWTFLAIRSRKDTDELKRWVDMVEEVVSQFEVSYLMRSPDIRRAYKFLDKHKKELGSFLEHNVVGNKNAVCRVIVEAKNPEETFEFLKDNADRLSQWISETERLKHISRVLVMRDDNIVLQRSDLMVPDKEGGLKSFDEVSDEEFLTALGDRLSEVLSPDLSMIEQATIRNIHFADDMDASDSGSSALPIGTLVHSTSPESFKYILSSGNLCGECIGMESSADSFPFHVDAIHVGPQVEDRTISGIMDSGALYQNHEYQCIYPYRHHEDAFKRGEEYTPEGSWITDHHLLFGGLPRTELGAIIISEKKGDEVNISDLKEEIVNNDIYVPVFSASGELLFTYEEFESMWEIQKPYGSLEELLDDDSYFENLDIPQSAAVHEFTLKEHLLRVEEGAIELAEACELDEANTLIVQAAARFHDMGKEAEPGTPQEIVNVQVAEEFLNKVRFLDIDTKRRILVLIRHDELLGEILQEMRGADESYTLSKRGKEMIKKFHKVFVTEDAKKALLALYRADIAGIGNNMYEEWEIDAKLAHLNLLGNT